MGGREELDMWSLRYCIDIFGISQRRINYEVEMKHHIHEVPRSSINGSFYCYTLLFLF